MKVFLEVVKCFGLFFFGILFSEYYNARIRRSYRRGRAESDAGDKSIARTEKGGRAGYARY